MVFKLLETQICPYFIVMVELRFDLAFTQPSVASFFLLSAFLLFIAASLMRKPAHIHENLDYAAYIAIKRGEIS